MIKKILIILLILVGLFFILYKNSHRTILLGDHELKVEVADSEAERIKGLSGKETLDSERGILFVFEEPDYYQFWMKDMKFSIDIIWLDEDKKIIHIEESVTPETFPRLFTPSKPAQYVIEVNAGWVKEKNISIGTQMYDRFSLTF